LNELKIQRSGAIDSATAKEIGRIAAVDAIVTGSITELERFIAINCRLIDTATGEVFGAAQTKITKDEDVTKIINATVGDDSLADGPRMSHSTSKSIATKDFGSLRVFLKSVRTILVRTHGIRMYGLRWVLEFNSREARKTIVVALNAAPWENGAESRYSSTATPLRSSVIDDRGGVWATSSASLNGVGFVRAGAHGRDGQQAYSAAEIVRLLSLRDRLGRDTDDPADGTSDSAGRVSGYRLPGDPPPPTFFPYTGNRFISGATTTIQPGQSVVVTLDFANDDASSDSNFRPTLLQFNSEIVVGVVTTDATKSYSLHNVTFDQVAMPRP
jgi:FlgO protein